MCGARLADGLQRGRHLHGGRAGRAGGADLCAAAAAREPQRPRGVWDGELATAAHCIHHCGLGGDGVRALAYLDRGNGELGGNHGLFGRW